MKYTQSKLDSAIALGAFKQLCWDVYVRVSNTNNVTIGQSARKNFVLNSESINSSPWINTNLNITDNLTGPSVDNPATKISYTGGGWASVIQQTFPGLGTLPGNTFNVSCYVSGSTTCCDRILTLFPDVATETITSCATGNYTVWTKLSASGIPTYASSGQTSLDIEICHANTGVGQFYISQLQVEEGNKGTSYEKTDSIVISADTGNWTNVSDKISEISDQNSKIEYEYGQYSSDALNLTVYDIEWWIDNIFTHDNLIDDYSPYIEIKITSNLREHSYISPVKTTTFYGFIDKSTIQFDEVSDSITFDVYTQGELGNRLSADSLTTQYIYYSISTCNVGLSTSSSVDVLTLKNIPGVYVLSASVPNYVLQEGYHKINYTYSTSAFYSGLSGIGYINIDDSDEPTSVLTAGYNGMTVETGFKSYSASGFRNVTSDDDQTIKFFVDPIVVTKKTTEKQKDIDLEDHIVVSNEGNVLPNNWHSNIGAQSLLTKCFDSIGLTSQTYDIIDFATYDGRFDVSFFETLPHPINGKTKRYNSIVCETDDISYIGIGNVVYKRVNSLTGVITTILWTNPRTYAEIARLFLDKTNDLLWILYDFGSNKGCRVYNLTTSTISNDLGIIDYGYWEDCGYDYCELTKSLVWVLNGADTIWELKWSADVLSESLIFNPSLTAYVPLPFTEVYDVLCVTANTTSASFFFCGKYARSPGIFWTVLRSVDWTGASWVNGADFGSSTYCIYNDKLERHKRYHFNYSEDENRFYYYEDYSTSHKLRSYKLAVPAAGEYIDLSNTSVPLFTSYNPASDSIIYFTAISASNKYVVPNNIIVYECKDLTYKEYKIPTISYNNDYYYIQQQLAPATTKMYGVDFNGIFFQYDDTLLATIKDGTFEDKTLMDVVNLVCKVYGCAYLIKSDKSVIIYKRANVDGTLRNSGSGIAVNETEISDIKKDIRSYPIYTSIIVQSGDDKTSYNGTRFSTFIKETESSLSLNEEIIPSNMIKDLVYYLYQFFKDPKVKYTVTFGTKPLHHVEPLDTCTITLLSSKILETTIDGVIYSTVYTSAGDVILEIQVRQTI